MNILEKIKTIINKNVKYDSRFFNNQWFNNWNDLKYILESLINSTGEYSNIIDYGCGPGVMIDFMNEDKKYNYYGYDNSADAFDLYLINYGANPNKYLREKKQLTEIPWDLCVSFDVLEHMENIEIEETFSYEGNFNKLFLNISREKHIKGHINIKNNDDWISFIENIGYSFNEIETDLVRNSYLNLKHQGEDKWNENLFIFVKNHKL